jgi:hypothetical protein
MAQIREGRHGAGRKREKFNMRLRQFWVWIALLAGICQGETAQAYTLHHLEDPIPVVSAVQVQQKDTRPGVDFYATLAEPLLYQGKRLPEGTEFMGHIREIRRMLPWGRQHRVDIWIDQVLLTNGQRYTVYPHEQVKPHARHWASPSPLPSQSLLEPGQRLYLQFQPATLKGMLKLAQPSYAPF